MYLHRHVSLSVALWIALGVGCGGDGPHFANGHVSGRIFPPLDGAIVRAVQLGDDGNPIGDTLGTSARTSAGVFELDVGSAYGTMLLTVDGGGASYQEIADDRAVSLDPGTALSAVLTNFAPDEMRAGVVISPYSHIAVSLAQARLARGDKETTIAKAADRAAQLLGDHLGNVRILEDLPADVTVRATNLTASVKYALALAGLSEMASQIAQVQQSSTKANNTVTMTNLLAADALSMEALFDGKAASGQLQIGLMCPSTDLASCYQLDPNTLRSQIGAGIITFIDDPVRNKTAITFSDAQAFLEAIRTDPNGELFPAGAPVGQYDTQGPDISFVSPADKSVVDHSISIEVTAHDATRVKSLVISLSGGATAPADTDATVERYLGSLNTTALPDGPLTLTATAQDVLGNSTTASISVTVNNLGPGTISGLCYKGPLQNSNVAAYQFTGGTKGTRMGLTTTGTDGRYTIPGLTGFSGPVVIECGGAGSYEEEAFLGSITLSTNDLLRTVLPSYSQGTNVNQVMVTPYTSIATAYLAWLVGRGAPVAGAYTTAYQAISNHLDFDITLQPANLTPTTSTLTDAAKHALALAAISQMAVKLAADGHATLGTAVNGVTVWQAYERDIGDGCFDGKDAVGAVVQVVGIPYDANTFRYKLAEQVATYMTNPRNLSQLTRPGDAIDFLDHLSLDGPTSSGAQCAAGQIFPTTGVRYDRVPPVIAWDALSPADAAVVKGTIRVKAAATDDITAQPTLTVTAPAGFADNDTGPSSVDGTIDTTSRADGPLAVTLVATDGAGNVGTSTRNLAVDNTAPAVTIDTGGVPNGGYSSANVAVSVSQSDAHPGTLSVTLDGGAAGTSFTVSAVGSHVVTAMATDGAGNLGTASTTFTIDKAAPVVTWDAPTPAEGAVVRQTISVGAHATDDVTAMPALVWTAPAGLADTDTGVSVVKGVIDTAQRADGALAISAKATDAAGKSTTATRNVVVDNTAPVVTIATGSVANGGYTNGSVSVSVTQTDANPGTLAVTLDGGTATTSFTVSAQGAHTISATATDLAGNVGTATRSFTIDTTAPSVVWGGSTPADGAVVHGTITVQATASDNSPTPTIVWTTPAGIVGMNPASGSNIDTTALTTGSTLVVTAKATDLAGNVTTSSRSYLVDNVAPTVALNPPGAYVDGSGDVWVNGAFQLNGTAGDVGSGVENVVVTVDGADHNATLTPPTGGTSVTWTYDYTWPQGATTAQFFVKSVDRGGLPSTQVSRIYHLDTTPPALTAVTTPAMYDEQTFVITFFGPHTPVPDYPCYGGVPRTGFSDSTLCNGGNTKNWGTASTPMTNGTDIYKYATRMKDTSANDNPIAWNLTADDSGGSGLKSVEYRIHWPASNQGEPAGATGWFVAAGSGSNRTIYVTATDAPKLKLLEGAWSLEVRATDNAGNTTNATNLSFSWNHYPLAPPVVIVATKMTSGPLAAANYVITQAAKNASGGTSNLATLINGTFGSGQLGGLIQLDVYNGSGEPANVGFSAAATGPTKVSGVWSERNADQNVANGFDCVGDGTAPPVLIDGSMCGYTQVTEASYCLVSGSPCTSPPDIMTGNPPMVPTLAQRVVSMTDTTCPGCGFKDPATTGPLYVEWTIPASESGLAKQVYLTANGGWSFLAIPGTTMADISVTGLDSGATPSAYLSKASAGANLEQYYKCTGRDVDLNCIAWHLFQRYRALGLSTTDTADINVDAGTIGVTVRARPDIRTGAQLLLGAPGGIPRYSDNLSFGAALAKPYTYNSKTNWLPF